MQQISPINVKNLPDVGYYVSKEQQKEEFQQNETHLIKNTPLTGVKSGIHKFTNDIFTYFPKGLSGSKNSDFYEYLSLGMFPYVVGSATLIAAYSIANLFYRGADKAAASKVAKRMGAGAVLYALGKWAHQKLAHTLINKSTDVNLDEKYIKRVIELPEGGQKEGIVRTQYPGTYDSAQFFRHDLQAKDGELNHDNVYYQDDKILKKAGYDEKLSAPNQLANQKKRGVKVRTTALENIGKYIVAATGVALGSQQAFGNIKLTRPSSIIKAFKDGTKQLLMLDKNIKP